MSSAYPILMYHQIADLPPVGTPFRHLTVAPRDFARQMQSMQRLGYRGLSMRDLQPYLDGTQVGKVFGITFDDGYVNVMRNAQPVLDALGFTATNYIVANRVGGSNDWDAAAGMAQVPLMTADDLRAWGDAGHEIGSHTLDHLDLTRQDPAVVQHQVADSRTQLEALCAAPVTAFCFPYGRYAVDQLDVVRAAGYRNATTIERGRARAAQDPLRLPRITIDGTAGLTAFLIQLLTPYEDSRAAWQRIKRSRSGRHA